MELICKHDSPGGIQDPDTFNRLNENGFVTLCWHFPCNDILHKIKNDGRFFKRGIYNLDIDIQKLIEFIKENLSEKGKNILLQNYNVTDINDEKISHFKPCNIRQFWKDLSLPINTKIYLLGKKNDLPEGYIIENITNDVYCVPNSIYKKKK